MYKSCEDQSNQTRLIELKTAERYQEALGRRVLFGNTPNLSSRATQNEPLGMSLQEHQIGPRLKCHFLVIKTSIYSARMPSSKTSR
jgi:hypothetical protein